MQAGIAEREAVLGGRIAAMEADATTLRAELARALEGQSALYASSSWRITAPLRGLARMVK